jgi:DNA-directed RNA polymerase alpha subunit
MKLKDKDRCKKTIAQYRSGSTLEEIGKKFGLTRERVRQLINKGLEYSVIEQKQFTTHDKSLKTLNLSDRAINGLIKNGIFTFSDLEAFSASDLLNLRSVGKKTGEEIIANAKKAGIKLKGQQSLFNEDNPPIPIDVFHFSTRTLNALVKANILTKKQLLSLSFLELKNIPGLGNSGYQEVIKSIKSSKTINQDSIPDNKISLKPTPIETLGFNDKALNALNKNSIYYVEQLLEYSKEELKKLQSLGPVALKNIIKVISENNYELNFVSLLEKVEIEFKKLKEEHKTNRLKLHIGEENIEDKRKNLLMKAQGYSSKAYFLRDTDITLTTLEELFPEVLEVLEKNRLCKKKQWSRNYIKCLECETTLIPHQGYGLCKKCYVKSDYFKEIQKLSHQKHKEKRKDQVRAYLKEYAKRPEVIEKNRRRDDIKKYGGNREKSILAYNSCCANCHKSRLESKKRWNKDLCVIHMDGNNKNNDMSNLKPLCYGCFMKHPKGGYKK